MTKIIVVFVLTATFFLAFSCSTPNADPKEMISELVKSGYQHSIFKKLASSRDIATFPDLGKDDPQQFIDFMKTNTKIDFLKSSNLDSKTIFEVKVVHPDIDYILSSNRDDFKAIYSDHTNDQDLLDKRYFDLITSKYLEQKKDKEETLYFVTLLSGQRSRIKK